MDKVRFGLIGYGRFGSLHARAIANTAGAELVAISARSQETCARAKAAHPDSDVSNDYRTLLRRSDLDVVDVVVPTYLHYEIGKAVLESGKHLFLEKPMATTSEECRQLCTLAESQRIRLAVGFKRRVAHLWRKVKEIIDDGAVGVPQYAVFELWRWPYRQGSQGWRYDKSRVGSWILEEPVHCFDKARWYFKQLGDPISIYASANSNQPGHPELLDNFNAIMRFPQNAHVAITQTLSAWGHHHGLKLTGSKGALWAKWTGARDSDLQPTSSLELLVGQEIREIVLPQRTGESFELEQEMAMMVRAVRDGKPVEATGSDGVWSVALCEAAQRSIDRGEVISVE